MIYRELSKISNEKKIYNPVEEEKVIASKNCRKILRYALEYSQEANISKLEDGMIDCGNAEWIYLFAKRITGANIVKLQGVMIALRNEEWIYQFATNIDKANKKEIFDYLTKNFPEFLKQKLSYLVGIILNTPHSFTEQEKKQKAIFDLDKIIIFINLEALENNVKLIQIKKLPEEVVKEAVYVKK